MFFMVLYRMFFERPYGTKKRNEKSLQKKNVPKRCDGHLDKFIWKMLGN